MRRSRQSGDELRGGVDSPCIDVCRMEGELCVGCHRTLDEIVRWSNASDDEKRGILRAVARRSGERASGSQSACNHTDQ